ncbi:MAG: hypothetical protein EP330_27125 [Deltaproteobacteria bacterium]|nr:MAG: hypothetical protein EP330_27125 [Deltaproteobacteria bacterium]
MGRLLAIAASLGLLVACTPELEGRWTGECDLDDPLRLVVEVDRTGDDARELFATVTLHQLSRLPDFLFLDCRGVTDDGGLGSVGACTGAWPGETEGAIALSFEGELDRGDPTATWTGECAYETGRGALELWSTP